MELNKIYKIKSIKLSKKIMDKMDNVEVKQRKPKTNLKKYILKPQIKENTPLVIIETGPFIIEL
jgi:S-adenosylmethionine synthetase